MSMDSEVLSAPHNKGQPSALTNTSNTALNRLTTSNTALNTTFSKGFFQLFGHTFFHAAANIKMSK
jgi:hypothetical protein